jgi:hypothetical protein
MLLSWEINKLKEVEDLDSLKCNLKIERMLKKIKNSLFKKIKAKRDMLLMEKESM